MTYPVKPDIYDDTIRCGFCQSLDHAEADCTWKKQAAWEMANGLAAACLPVDAAVAAMERPRK